MLKSDDVYYTGEQSVGRQMRQKRMKLFLDLLENVPKPCRILDVGGEPNYWKVLGFQVEGVEIVCMNLNPRKSDWPNVTSVAGNAISMPEYADQSFDIVYSNSVIEHLFTTENQFKMASEVRRVGKRYFVQTPNKYFPIEPHFLFPLWQFLPREMRIRMIQKRRVGFAGPASSREDAEQIVDEILLISKSDFQKMFPDGTLIVEKFKGFSKSFMVHHGF